MRQIILTYIIKFHPHPDNINGDLHKLKDCIPTKLISKDKCEHSRGFLNHQYEKICLKTVKNSFPDYLSGRFVYIIGFIIL